MFTLSHTGHSTSWLTATGGQMEPAQCLAYLLDELRNSEISPEQRHMHLEKLRSLVEESEMLLDMLVVDVSLGNHILGLMAGYTHEPYRRVAVCVCSSLVHKVQSERLFGMLMDKFENTLTGNNPEAEVHFCLLVLGKLCDLSRMYADVIVQRDKWMSLFLDVCMHTEESTVSSCAYLLVYLTQAILSVPDESGDDLDIFLWKVMESLVRWLTVGLSHELQVNCLLLLKELLQSEKTLSGLLLVGCDSLEGHSLLMGLKRVLATKEKVLVAAGTQCLTMLMKKLSEPQQIKNVFDTDLAEFIFELLHTSNVSQQESVLQCLLTMANHKLFFEKCHAAYGLESTLKALRMAIETKSATIVDKGMTFLTHLLERQPANIPLFMNQSWLMCVEFLQEALQQDDPSVFYKALQCTMAVFMPQHQQNPVDIKSVICLVSKATEQSRRQLMDSPGENMKQEFAIMNLTMDITVVSHRFLFGDSLSQGNDREKIEELMKVLKIACGTLIIPWICEHWDCLSDDRKTENYLTCLDMFLSGHEENETSDSILMMSWGLPCQILALLSQPNISEDTQKLGSHVLAGWLVHLSNHIKPSLYLCESTLITGFSSLLRQGNPVELAAVEKLTSKEEVAATLAVFYFSYLNGYRVLEDLELKYFMETVYKAFPDLLSYEAVVVRAFVCLWSICQSTSCDGREISSFGNDLIEQNILIQLKKKAVEVWYTRHPDIFQWSLLTEQRMGSVGRNLVEYWLLNLQVSAPDSGSILTRMSIRDKDIVHRLRSNFNFMFTLVSPEDADDPMFEKLFISVTQRFEALTSHGTDVNDTTSSALLSVLCALLSHSQNRLMEWNFSHKSICYVIRLASQSDASEETVMNTLQFLATVTCCMLIQDCNTVLAPIVENAEFVVVLENCLNNPKPSISLPALTLTAWLSQNGQDYQAGHPVTVTSCVLLTNLANGKHLTILPILHLLTAALSAMSKEFSPLGTVHFLKRELNFESRKVFSVTELKQIYVYLQQIVLQEKTLHRIEAVDCMKKLFALGQEIREQLLQQPWNSVMLESLLSSRTEKGVTDAELDLCLLISPSCSAGSWTETAVKMLLLAFLNSQLSSDQHTKAVALVEQIKLSAIDADEELMVATERHFRTL